MIVQHAHAISDEDCRSLMETYDQNMHRTDVRDRTNHPILYWKHLKHIPDLYWKQLKHIPEAKRLFCEVIDKTGRNIGQKLKIGAPAYLETVILTAIGPGGYRIKHADNATQNESGEWMPNHTPNRDISAVCYLNEEFEGGELVFEQHRVAIRPRRGLIVLFPSDQTHVHEVLPVRSGRRYTVAMWFTTQKDRRAPAFAN
jgi:hypothetical protein